MADNDSSSSGVGSRHRNSRRDDSPSTSGVSNDDKKLNPWKPISAPENNALEADAWPEPSVGDGRRIMNSKATDDKAKRKIKWQNFDDDGNSCGFSKGRGRYSGVPFNPPYGPANSMNSYRRGSGGYRPRGADYYRGRGSFYHRNKVYQFRLAGGFDRSATSDTTVNSVSEGNKVADEMANLSVASTDDISEDIVSVTTANASSSNDVDSYQSNMSSTVNSKRSYRDRIAGVAQNASHGHNTIAYEAGAVGRARRSYLRQQPSFQSDQDISMQQPLIPMPLLPFHQFTYYIPGVGGTLLGPAGIPVAPGLSSNISITSETSGAYSSELAFNQLSTGNNADATATIISDPTCTTAHLLEPNQSALLSSEITGGIKTIVVDVSQMVAYINSVGWNDVVFPSYLLEDPPVAAAIRSLVSDTSSFDAFLQRNNETSAISTSNDEAVTNPTEKRADVIIVENKVFFVPRNANRTKFLKFFSKSDYIRHHIEYYFSDSNLDRDVHLLTILSKHHDVCPVEELLLFNRLRWANTTYSELLDAAEQSSELHVSYSTDGNPLGIGRNSTPDAGASLPVSSTSTISDVIASNADGCSIPDRPTDVAISPSTIVQQLSHSPAISITSSSVSHGLQSSVQQSFVQPQTYLPMPRADTTDASVYMNLPYMSGTNSHLNNLAGNVPSICPLQYYANPLDLSGVTQPNTGSGAPPQQMSVNQTAHLFSGNRQPPPSAYTSGGQPAYLAVSPNLAALQAANDPNATSLMTALYRVGGAPGVTGNMGGPYMSSLGNTGNAIAPGYAAQQNGSTVLLQLIPGATHPSTGGYYPNGNQATGVPGPTFLNRNIQNAISPPNLWIPLGATVSQNIGSVHPHGTSNSLQSVVAFPPTATGMPLATTVAVSTATATALYPTLLPQVPIPINAFALVPNPTMETNQNANVISGGSGPGALLGGASEATGHQRPIHGHNTYVFNNHSAPGAVPVTGSNRFSGHPNSISEGGAGHLNSKKPASSTDNAGDGHS